MRGSGQDCPAGDERGGTGGIKVTELREEKHIALEIGQQVVDAADSIRKFLPDCQAIVQFELDGMDFIAIVRDKAKGP